MRTTIMVGLSAVLGVGLTSGRVTAQQGDMVHAHVGHVLDAWKAAPDGKGLLPTAVAEAEIAVQHAELAAKDTSNLDAMKRHAGHVINALDPSIQASGPGLGFGVKEAAAGVSRHIGLAAAVEGAPDGVKNHGGHVKGFADITVTRVDDAVAMAQRILDASSAAEAAPHTEHVSDMVKGILEGEDANGDGKIGLDEGGLRQAEAHMGLLKKSIS